MTKRNMKIKGRKE